MKFLDYVSKLKLENEEASEALKGEEENYKVRAPFGKVRDEMILGYFQGNDLCASYFDSFSSLFACLSLEVHLT